MSKNNKEVLCYSCNKPIKTIKDLVVANYVIYLKPFHNNCYIRELKSLFFFRNYPINSTIGTFAAVGSPILGVLLLIALIYVGKSEGSLTPENFSQAFVIFLITFVPTAWRLYSYYKFEKPLKK